MTWAAADFAFAGILFTVVSFNKPRSHKQSNYFLCVKMEVGFLRHACMGFLCFRFLITREQF